MRAAARWLFCVALLLFLATTVHSAASSLEELSALHVDLLNQLKDVQEQIETHKVNEASKASKSPITNAIAVVGGGLSGLTASLRLLEEGHKVILIEKRQFMGGNSAYASSGINGCKTERQGTLEIEDSPDRFYDDTIKSSQRQDGTFTSKLVRRMVDGSKEAVEWIASRSNVPLDEVGQLGGHSFARTHRPTAGLAGAAFISGLEKAVMKYEGDGGLVVLKGSRLIKLQRLDNNGRVVDGASGEDGLCETLANGETVCDKSATGGWGLTLQRERTGETVLVKTPGVILATGGYANDKGPGSLLNEVSPHLQTLSSTNGKFATGDGVKLGRSLGAKIVDLDLVQVHPTGFSDAPKGFADKGKDRSLVLCAEIVRGAGGVILDRDGHRFIDELETRKTVVEAMRSRPGDKFIIAVPPHAAPKIEAHINIYTGKGLLHPVNGYEGITQFIMDRLHSGGSPPLRRAVRDTFLNTTLNNSYSPFRRTHTKLPLLGEYHVGVIEPVLHYTMGGLGVDPEARVLNAKTDAPIRGLYASGEIMGGVHGINRLGGSSLLDCVVFGLAAARSSVESLSARTTGTGSFSAKGVAHVIFEGEGTGALPGQAKAGGQEDRKIVTVNGRTFDLTDFIPNHPGGPISVEPNEDLTDRFVHAHGSEMGLFDRESIVEIGKDGNKKVREKKFYEDYGSKGGSWREFIGRRAWFVLHSFAAKYPEHPGEDDKIAMTNLIAAFGQLYPCKLCRKHLQQQLREPSLGPPRVESRQALSTWVCELHNIVNADIGKPQVPCKPFQIDLMYLKDCGECEITKKTDDKDGLPASQDDTIRSGYHAPTGPWDAEIYRRDQALLASVKDTTDAWETKDLVELVDAMDVLRKWFRVFKKKDLKNLRKALREGKAERAEWVKRLQDIMRPALQTIDKGALKKV